MTQSELWWASIGGHKCEPVRVMLNADGSPIEWFSIGCADAHPVGPGMTLVGKIEDGDIPPRPQDSARQRKRWEREHANAPGYRRF